MRTDIFSIAPNGQILGLAKGSGELLASAQGLNAATAVSVDVPDELLPLSLYVIGLGVYPQAVALPPTGQRQMLVNLSEVVDLRLEAVVPSITWRIR